MRIRRGTLASLATVAALAGLSTPAFAAPEGPGWELSATSYPTNFVHGVNEVQEVVTNEAAGTFTLAYEGSETASIPDHATDAQVQAALEDLSSVGTGNVSVTGGTPGTFIVTFTEALGSTKVAELEASGAGSTVTKEGSSSGTIGVDVFNVGATASHGTITVTDTLPPGVKAKEAGVLVRPAQFEENFGIDPVIERGMWECTGNGTGGSTKVAGATVVTCTNGSPQLERFEGGGGTPTSGGENHHPQPAVGVSVEVEPATEEGTKAGSEANKVTIAGGGAHGPAATSDPVTFSKDPAQGGITQADAWFSNADGTIDRQAGSHPYTATFIFTAATALNGNREGYLPGGEIRNLETEVPPGLVGDLHNIAQCTRAQLFVEKCPPASMVGRLKVATFGVAIEEQVYNMVPAAGVPAELGFNYGSVPVYITFSVRSGSDYGVVAHVNNIPQRIAYQSILTLWGVPEETSHNVWRHGESGCSQAEMEAPPFNGSAINYCAPQAGVTVAPFLRLPTSCSDRQTLAIREINGWQNPAAKSEVAFVSHDAGDRPAGFTGCEALGTEPVFLTEPNTAIADTPTGVTFDVKPPLGGSEHPEDLTPADIQNTTVTLPEGFVVNPGQAAGLQVCPPGRPAPGHQFGDALTTSEEHSRGEEDLEAPVCPGASRVGTVTIKSPLIEAAAETQFQGAVYVLPSNPPEVKLLVAASADGVNIKLLGTVHLNEQTGRIETTFKETPQLPFSDFKLTLQGGSGAALLTPTRCGTYGTSADFTPWSTPLSSDSLQNATFAILEGAQGTACPGASLPFSPSHTSGARSAQAGGFTSFVDHTERGDGQQRLEKLQLTMPRGLSALISSITPCQEPAAGNGTCPAGSHIGHATVTAGPGSSPLVLPQPGEPEVGIYLTGPYKGAPFGLSIVTPVLAGPFNLGTVVTRAKVEVDPHTAQVTITTDPFPQILKGVPTQLRSLDGTIDRPGFLFDPTNCEQQQLSATISGAVAPGETGTGASATVATPFNVTGCRALTFTPKVAVATGAKASRPTGASLSFKISYPKGAFGSQAWFKEAKFTVPKQLPARLSTLHQACLAKVFETERQNCPKHSRIGTAIVHTQVLPVPLEGPVYFVSNAGLAFPNVVMDLRGDGVHVELVGNTLIRNGVTSATFPNTPDVPFENIEVTLPTGEYSEFGANLPHESLDFCGQKLTVPTELRAQNGLEIHQNTPVAVNGCPSTISLRSHSHTAHSLTVSVYVPAPGKLTVAGKNLRTTGRSTHGQEDVNLTLHAKRTGMTKITLNFQPGKGRRQHRTIRLTA
jgi:hypothetical protein